MSDRRALSTEDLETQTHWAQRCRERGFRGNPRLFWREVKRAVAAARQGDESAAARVCVLATGSVLYRVLTPDGMFYPVINPENGNPVTLLVAGMIVTKQNGKRKRLGAVSGVVG